MVDFLLPAEELSYAEWFFRTLAVGVEIYLLGRYLPRRAGGPYAAYDFSFFWMMGGLAASPLFDPKIGFAPTIAAAVTIYTAHYLLSSAATKSRKFAALLMGDPVVLISKGKLIRENMLKSLLPVEILLSELRAVNVFNLNEIEYAILETSGHVSVIKKPEFSPVTASDLQLPASDSLAPIVVVNDGHIVEENIEKLGHSRKSFLILFSSQCPYVPEQIYLATLDKAGTLYYSEYSTNVIHEHA